MVRFFVLAVVAGFISPACADEAFEFKPLAACDSKHNAYGPDKLVAERKGERLLVTGWSGITCGEQPANARVHPDWGTLTLSLEYKADGPVAVCRCTSKFQFSLEHPVRAGQTIYFVKDGRGTAHVVAP